MATDTTARALAIQESIFRRMTAEQRLRIALEMSDTIRELALAGLRARRRDLDDAGLRRELLRLMYGTPPDPQ